MRRGNFFIMENNKGEELRDSISHIKQWINLEVEYLKLTASEKISVLLSSLILVLVLFIVGLVVLIVFALALIDLFSLFMAHALACVTVGGIFILLILMLYLLRTPLVINPITKLITKLFLTPKKDKVSHE